jgi:hypothetical protein
LYANTGKLYTCVEDMYIISKHIIKHCGVFSRWNNYGIIWLYLGIEIGLEASRNNSKKTPGNPGVTPRKKQENPPPWTHALMNPFKFIL